MLKTYIQQQIKAYSNPVEAAAKISFNMVHLRRTASSEDLQRWRDDLALILRAASPSRAADQIAEYMSSRQLTFLGSSNPTPPQKASHKTTQGKKAIARASRSGGAKVVFKTKAA